MGSVQSVATAVNLFYTHKTVNNMHYGQYYEHFTVVNYGRY